MWSTTSLRAPAAVAAALLAALVIASFLASPGLTQDESVAVYGPYVYTRDTGKPEVVTDLFSASAEARECRLIIHNGQANGASAGPSSGPSATPAPEPSATPSGVPSGGIESPPMTSPGNENDKAGEDADSAGREDARKAEQKRAKLAEKAAKQAEREARKQAKAAEKNQVASARASAAAAGANGNSGGKKQRVTSARVHLNDLELFKPGDFNKKVSRLEAPVDLLPMNALSVELRGKPGSCFTLEIRCAGDMPPDNTPPVADAGPDQSVLVGEMVKLDGSGSSDMDSDPLTFHWGFQSVPPESNATLSDPTAVMPTFDVDRPGTYLVDLVVNDGMADSAPDTVAVSTENSPPSADAGTDQTVKVGDAVKLDGSGSSDADGDALTFAWSFLMTPAGSGATLDDPGAVMPMFTADLPGDYVAELVVNDGTADSEPDMVTVSTENSAPVADAGTDETVMVGAMVTLDGSGSSDPDDDALSFAWSLTSVPPGSTAMLSNADTAMPSFTADLPGMYVAQLVVNDGLLDSAPDTVKISTENSPPVADAGEDQMVLVGDTVMLSGLGSFDPDGDMITYAWSFTSTPMGSTAMLSNADTAMPSFTADEPGMYVAQLIVNDGLLDSAPDTVVAEATIIVPDDDSDNDGLTDAEEAELGTDPDNPDTDGDGLTDGAEVNVHGTSPKKPDTDGDGYRDDVEVANQTNPLDGNDFPMDQGPPDPALIAPMPDMTVPSTLADATAFLYTGANPIQTGVAPETIKLEKAAVLRGKVTNAAGQPLAAVGVSVLGHPELGQTQSRADGMYDLAVNGGTRLTLAFSRAGFLPAQRGLMVPQQDFVMAPDVALVQLDPMVTAVDLGAGGMQMARGSVIMDDDGMRQATVMFPSGTSAEMVMPDGSMHAINNLSVRATEYTVGDMGPMMMPAQLPPTSGYTYAVELSVDEAMAAGAMEVRFNQPLPMYVENFLGFPAGTPVPVGYYDRTRGLWVPSDDGRVIAIVGETGGMADVDVDGDDIADTGDALAALGITDEERAELALLYAPGQSLWRSPIPHFSSWDKNWPFGPPLDALPPLVPDTPPEEQEEETCEAGGSILECQNQVLGERFPVAGTPFTLNYRSSRVPGHVASRRVRIPVIGSIISPSLKRMELDINIAGRSIQRVFGRGVNINDTFIWDGLDAYGRMIPGTRTARMNVAYVYDGVYGFTDQPGSDFGATPEFTIEGSESREEILLRRTFSPRNLTTRDARGQGLGGWTLDVHHTYDTAARILYLGDGRKRSAEGMSDIITRVAGMVDDFNYGERCCDDCDPEVDEDCDPICDPVCGDGKPATEAFLNTPRKIDFGPDGTLYIVESFRNRIRQVTPDGFMSTFAGTGEGSIDPQDGSHLPNGDGGPAILAKVDRPLGVAAGSDGSVYIAEQFRDIVRKVDPQGFITTFAGGGTLIHSGIPATDIRFVIPGGIDVGPDGSLYVADVGQCLVWRITADGMGHIAAGHIENCGYDGDGGPATLASISGLESLAVGDDGTLYLMDSQNYRVRAVTPDGIINTIAGTGTRANERGEGDGGPAILANLDFSYDIAAGPDGSVYFAESSGDRIRQVSPDGFINTVAGKDSGCPVGNEGLPATAGCTFFPEGVGVGPDGYVYVSNGHNVDVVRPVLTGLSTTDFAVASEDGTELYVFDATGRHLRTVNALTGAPRYEFRYDAAGLLIEIEDGHGNVTIIERDGAGHPQAIIGPFGQRTDLALDANGFLAGITNPASETHGFDYTPDGLLTTYTDPLNEDYTYAYDDLGRLVQTHDPAGGGTTFARTDFENGFQVERTTMSGRTSAYRVDSLVDGRRRLRNTLMDGSVAQVIINPNGTRTLNQPDGTQTTTELGPDPRFGMQAPIPVSRTTVTPDGASATTTVERNVVLADPKDPLSLVSLEQTTETGSNVRSFAYDAATRTLTATSPEGRPTTVTVDPQGRLTQRTISGVPFSAAYDALGRLETLTLGSGAGARETRLAYDAEGFVQSVTDATGRVASFEHDPIGRITRQILPGGREMILGYDARGNRNSITTPNGTIHGAGFNALGYEESYDPPALGGSGTVSQYSYNTDRQLMSIARPDGKMIDFSYNATGRLEALTFPRGTVSYGFDATTKRISSITAPGGLTLAFEFDGGLPTRETWGGEIQGSVSRTYGVPFRSTEIRVNDADPVNYELDRDGLLRRAGSLTVAREAATGRPTGTTLGGVTDTWTYSALGEVESYVARFNGTPILMMGYTRDDLGRAATRTETIGGVTDTYVYSYDPAARLQSVMKNGAAAGSYTYDANGNRVSRTAGMTVTNATYDDQDRLLTYGAAAYAFSDEGVLQTKTVGAEVTTYGYDALENLISVDLPDGTAVSYLVDGLNRRVGKKVDGTLVQGFLYKDQVNPIAELDAANNVVSRFVYGMRGHVPDYLVKGGATYRIVSDLVGSVRLVVNVATGDVAQRLDYDEFGNVLLDTNPGFQPFGFAGGLYDAQTGLVRFGARDYDPETGRWTSKDPLRFAGGNVNLYTYVANDPINMADPSGLLSEAQCEIIQTILRHEEAFGTWATAKEFSNTVGKNRMGDLFDNKPVDTVLGTMDMDWFTDLVYFSELSPGDNIVGSFIGPQIGQAVETTGLYVLGKTIWNVIQLNDGTREAFVYPFQDPKERVTMLALLLGYDTYAQLFPEDFLQDECGGACEQ